MDGADCAPGHVGEALPAAVQLSATGLEATGLDAGGDPDAEPVPVAAPHAQVNKRAKNRVLRRISSSFGTGVDHVPTHEMRAAGIWLQFHLPAPRGGGPKGRWRHLLPAVRGG